MAKKVVVQLVDDIDGGAASETVVFALDGTTYEIDLSDDHAAQLRESLSYWIANGRRSTGRRAAPRGPRRAGGNSDTARIREWARSQGIPVPERGRVSAELRERYERESN